MLDTLEYTKADDGTVTKLIVHKELSTALDDEIVRLNMNVDTLERMIAQVMVDAEALVVTHRANIKAAQDKLAELAKMKAENVQPDELTLKQVRVVTDIAKEIDVLQQQVVAFSGGSTDPQIQKDLDAAIANYNEQIAILQGF